MRRPATTPRITSRGWCCRGRRKARKTRNPRRWSCHPSRWRAPLQLPAVSSAAWVRASGGRGAAQAAAPLRRPRRARRPRAPTRAAPGRPLRQARCPSTLPTKLAPWRILPGCQAARWTLTRGRTCSISICIIITCSSSTCSSNTCSICSSSICGISRCGNSSNSSSSLACSSSRRCSTRSCSRSTCSNSSGSSSNSRGNTSKHYSIN
mmetsp:Transcript_47334/g.133540  ORF Transcript_47334/g.133540 Transcript_47334/m.133540 type:complete len:208 (+) Transcript_47334:154-777(+)